MSISEVLFVINGGPPQEMDPELARRGIAAHKKIEKEVAEGKIPPSLAKAGLKPPITVEKRVCGNMGNTQLSARIDLVGDNNMIVDLKPGADIQGRHLLQAAMAASANGEIGKAAVHLYGSGRTYVITDGGQSAREEIGVVVTNARRILENEAEMKTQRRTLGSAGMQQKGRETVRLRQELERNLSVAMEKIKSKLVKYQ